MITKPDEAARRIDPFSAAKQNQEENLISMVKGLSDDNLLFMIDQLEGEINSRIDRARAMIDKFTRKH